MCTSLSRYTYAEYRDAGNKFRYLALRKINVEAKRFVDIRGICTMSLWRFAIALTVI